jgi:DsbC/DsbD-like thiol-disulfide interchange protein
MIIQAVFLTLAAGAALAQDASDVVTASILPGWQTDAGTHMAALRLDLAPGWKTYWRAPGEAGIPPEFDWAGSENIDGVTLHWPRPVVFETNEMQSVGYHDLLILPIEIEKSVPGEPVNIALMVDFGVCKDVCMPARINVTGWLPPQGTADPLIRAALADQPQDGRAAGVQRISCKVEPVADGMRVTATLAMPPMGGEETVVLENSRNDVWVSEALTRRDGGTLTASVDMVDRSGAPFLLSRDQVVVTVLAGARAIEMRGCPSG